MKLKKIFIKKNVFGSLISGHPWCFSGAIEKNEKGINDGDLCEVYYADNFIGIGYFNSSSDIRVRILTREKREIDTDFFTERFSILKKTKESYLENTDAYRLVFGESDNVPGLVADVYGKSVIIQVHTLGIERLKKQIVDALARVMSPEMIYERSDIEIRKKEGLPKETKELLYGKETAEIIITENGRKFKVNVIEGQKTGFFLDQRENRKALEKYSQGRKVLNCFSYTGGFSVYAAATAESVTSVDISKPAIAGAKANFELNGYDLSKHNFLPMDVFDYLKEIKPGEFDMIILDPPSFAKNRAQLKNAIKAYITINSKALEKLPDYGILVSSSCTTHVDEQTFIKILFQSSVNAKCQLKMIESKIQPPDHSYNLAFPEGRYLKFMVMQKFPIA